MTAEMWFYVGGCIAIGAGGIAILFGVVTNVMGEDRGAGE